MLAEITDYSARAKAKLLAQYSDKPLVAGIIGELGGLAQEAEAAIWDLIAETSIDTSTGVWLDRLGAIIGEARDGAADVDYRAFIKARIYANRSNGRVEDLISVVKAWNGGILPTLFVTQYYPAAVELRLGVVVTVIERLLRLLKCTRSAAIGQMVLYQTVADAAAFTFSSSAAPEASATQGFGDSTTPATGGSFVGAERA